MGRAASLSNRHCNLSILIWTNSDRLPRRIVHVFLSPSHRGGYAPKAENPNPWCFVGKILTKSWAQLGEISWKAPNKGSPQNNQPILVCIGQCGVKHSTKPQTSRSHQRYRKMQLPTMYDVVPMIIKPATANTKGRSKSWSSSWHFGHL